MTTDQKVKRVFAIDKELKNLKALHRAMIRFRTNHKTNGYHAKDDVMFNNVASRITRLEKAMCDLLPDDGN